ncbi:MAG: rRNA maturation RNase YbeY, partial [Firmicutes bacterium ZCTH02-B6]
VISVPRARAQSEEYGHSLEREIGFLFVHGFLHLIGYDHDTEEAEKAMFGRQEQILAEVGLTR